MSYHTRDDDMFLDLAQAIYADDLARAKDVLALMHNIGSEPRAQLIRRARQSDNPLPAPPPLREPILLPSPGADPHTHFGGQANFHHRRRI